MPEFILEPEPIPGVTNITQNLESEFNPDTRQNIQRWVVAWTTPSGVRTELTFSREKATAAEIARGIIEETARIEQVSALAGGEM